MIGENKSSRGTRSLTNRINKVDWNGKKVGTGAGSRRGGRVEAIRGVNGGRWPEAFTGGKLGGGVLR